MRAFSRFASFFNTNRWYTVAPVFPFIAANDGNVQRQVPQMQQQTFTSIQQQIEALQQLQQIQSQFPPMPTFNTFAPSSYGIGNGDSTFGVPSLPSFGDTRDRTDILIAQFKADIAQSDGVVLAEYQKMNKKRSKIRRNKWILNYFVDYLLSKSKNISADDINAMRSNNELCLIPKRWCQDQIIASFVAWASEKVKENGLQYRGFMRALHGTLSDTLKEYHISNDFKSSSLFQAKSIMSGAQSSELYKKNDSKQARACTDEEYNKIMNMSVLKECGAIDEFKLTEKAGFSMTTGWIIRGADLHCSVNNDVIFGVDTDGYAYCSLRIGSDKTNTETFFKTIVCDEVGVHNKGKINDDACALAVIEKYMERKEAGIVYMRAFARPTSKKSIAVLADPGTGPLITRVKYKKTGGDQTYISVQRRGGKNLNFTANLAKSLGFSTEPRQGQKDKWSVHSGKRTGVVQVASKGGLELEDSDCKELSGHRTMDMFNHYANRGQFKSKQASRKFAEIKIAQKLAMAQQQSNGFGNNNNSNNNNIENIPPVPSMANIPLQLRNIPRFDINQGNGNGYGNANGNAAVEKVHLHGGSVLSQVINDENGVGMGEWDANGFKNDEEIANGKAGGNEGSVEYAGIGLSGQYYISSRCNNVKTEF